LAWNWTGASRIGSVLDAKNTGISAKKQAIQQKNGQYIEKK